MNPGLAPNTPGWPRNRARAPGSPAGELGNEPRAGTGTPAGELGNELAPPLESSETNPGQEPAQKPGTRQEPPLRARLHGSDELMGFVLA
jgi:hypothetical protein